MKTLISAIILTLAAATTQADSITIPVDTALGSILIDGTLAPLPNINSTRSDSFQIICPVGTEGLSVTSTDVSLLPGDNLNAFAYKDSMQKFKPVGRGITLRGGAGNYTFGVAKLISASELVASNYHLAATCMGVGSVAIAAQLPTLTPNFGLSQITVTENQ